MPIPALRSLGKKTGKSTKTMERYWEGGKKSAKKRGVKNKYAYAMAIAKRRAGIKETDLRVLKSPLVRERLSKEISKFGQRLGEALTLDTDNRLIRVELVAREGTELVVRIISTDQGTFDINVRDGDWADISRQIEEKLVKFGYSREEIINVPSKRGS
jgi:hypothetical protein